MKVSHESIQKEIKNLFADINNQNLEKDTLTKDIKNLKERRFLIKDTIKMLKEEKQAIVSSLDIQSKQFSELEKEKKRFESEKTTKTNLLQNK